MKHASVSSVVHGDGKRRGTFTNRAQLWRDQFSNTLSTLISQMETVVRKAQHFIDTHISNGNRRWFPTLRNGKEGRFQADFKLITSAPATPADPVSTPRAPDLAEATPPTPADPSSISLTPDAVDSANAPAVPADPSSLASDPADFMRKVLATWADALSMSRARTSRSQARPPHRPQKPNKEVCYRPIVPAHVRATIDLQWPLRLLQGLRT